MLKEEKKKKREKRREKGKDVMGVGMAIPGLSGRMYVTGRGMIVFVLTETRTLVPSSKKRHFTRQRRLRVSLVIHS